MESRGDRTATAGNDCIVNEEEVEIVRKIYADFLADVPMGETAQWLESIGYRCTTKYFVKTVFQNPTYTGVLLLQRHFSPQVRHMQKNNGEMPKYLVTGHHPAIISRETFEQVQQKMQVSLEFNPEAHRIGRVSCFSSKIISWRKVCQNGNLPVELLEKLCTEVIGDFSEEVFVSTVHNLLIHPDGNVIFTFYDGSTKEGKVHFYRPEDRKHLNPHTRIYGYARVGDTCIICEEEALSGQDNL